MTGPLSAPYNARPRPFLPTLAVAALPVLPACDAITGTDRAEEIRLQVDGEDLKEAVVRVIVSSNFLVGSAGGQGTTVEFIEADTQAVGVPFEETYPGPDTGLFLVRVPSPELPPGEPNDDEGDDGSEGDEDQGPTGTVSLRVMVDGSVSFDETQAVGGTGHLQWVHVDR